MTLERLFPVLAHLLKFTFQLFLLITEAGSQFKVLTGHGIVLAVTRKVYLTLLVLNLLGYRKV